MRKFLLLAAVTLVSTSLFAQKPAWEPGPGHLTIPLWPHGAPGTASGTTSGAAASNAPEVDTTTAKDRLIAGQAIVRLGNGRRETLW